jgi:hypothetical protein
MSVQVADLLQHPANRAKLAKAAAARLREIEGREQAEEAERAARASRSVDASEAKWREAEMAKCAADVVYFFNAYLWTYDPRLLQQIDPLTGKRRIPFVQFKLWTEQEDWVRWAANLWDTGQEGITEKSRDTGVSYLCCGLGLHHWLFVDGFKLAFGSRKAEYVDDKDDADSLFEKLRIMLRRLPEWMVPKGFNWREHSSLMKLTNPANGASIGGEAGKEMGRGGRSTVYVWDETAFSEGADGIERAISANTDALMMVSSANGMGNLFFRKRMSMDPARVFRLHYSSDPRKTPAWVKAKKESLKHNPTAWASEYEIDYAASLEGVCIPAAWVQSAQRLAKLIRPAPRLTPSVAGLDVGAGKAVSVFISRNGPRVRRPVSRGDPDTTGTALWALALAVEHGCGRLNYDAPGVGVGVTSGLKHAENKPADLTVRPINTGNPAPKNKKWPDKRTSYETFGNLKGDLWWSCRTACQKSHEKLQWIDREVDEDGVRLGVDHDIEECLLLPSGDPESDKLGVELSVVKADTNTAGKIVIETKVALKKRGILSPDYADALVLTWAPVGPYYDPGALA